MFKYKEVIKILSNNNSIVILKQDKGRGFVIMNRSAYLEEIFILLNTSQFKKLTKDPKHATEQKIQSCMENEAETSIKYLLENLSYRFCTK